MTLGAKRSQILCSGLFIPHCLSVFSPPIFPRRLGLAVLGFFLPKAVGCREHCSQQRAPKPLHTPEPKPGPGCESRRTKLKLQEFMLGLCSMDLCPHASGFYRLTGQCTCTETANMHVLLHVHGCLCVCEFVCVSTQLVYQWPHLHLFLWLSV